MCVNKEKTACKEGLGARKNLQKAISVINDLRKDQIKATTRHREEELESKMVLFLSPSVRRSQQNQDETTDLPETPQRHTSNTDRQAFSIIILRQKTLFNIIFFSKDPQIQTTYSFSPVINGNNREDTYSHNR